MTESLFRNSCCDVEGSISVLEIQGDFGADALIGLWDLHIECLAFWILDSNVLLEMCLSVVL
jgi:hypothetical protein